MFPESPYLWLPSIPCPWPAKSAEIKKNINGSSPLAKSVLARTARDSEFCSILQPNMCLIIKGNRLRNVSRY